MRRISSVLTVIGTAAVAFAVPEQRGAAAAPAPAVKELTMRPTGERAGVPRAGICMPQADQYRATVEKAGMDPVRLDIRRAGMTKVVLSITGFRLVTEDGHPYWVSDPIVLDAVGSYAFDLYAKDPVTGIEGTRSDNKTFLYAPGAVIDVASGKQEFSLDSVDAVATGRVTAEDPKTGARVAVPGTRVEVYTDRKHVFYGKTDADGRYSIPFSATGTEYDLALEAVFTDGETYAAAIAPLKIQRQKAFVTLTGPTTNLTVPYGDHHVPGKLARLAADGTLKPVGAGHYVAGSCVTPAGCASWTSTAVTKADGSFEIASKVAQPGTWTIRTRSPWLETDTRGDFTVTEVTHTTRMTEEQLTITADGKLSFTGKALLVGGATTATAPINVEALRADGSWWRVRTTPRPFGATFEVEVDVPPYQVNAWRLGVAQTRTTAPSTGAKILKTAKLHAWLTQDPVRSHLAKGSPLTMKGSLYTLTPEGTVQPLAGRKVHYFFKAAGSTAWEEVSTSTTGATGHYRRTVVPAGSGEWQVRFTDGGTARFDNTTYPVTVTVR